MSCHASPLATHAGEAEDFPDATTNACKLCTPLGACLAFKGVRDCMPFLHGSQGCATYIRRYLIGHFREPVDIAASNFSESAAVFGGGANLRAGLENVNRQYQPELIGVATTCLSETIGEDMPRLLVACHEQAREAGQPLPATVRVSTPSFRGSHVDGYHATVLALVEQLAESTPSHEAVAVFPGMVSPADLRMLKSWFEAYGLGLTLTPDYSETLDGGSWGEYHRMSHGGTPVSELRRLGGARAAIEFGRVLAKAEKTAATHLRHAFDVPAHRLGMPIGIHETDRLASVLTALSGKPLPAALAAERARLVDSYVDGHKFVAGRRVVLAGDQDLVVGLTAFCAEIGLVPVLCASGGSSGRLTEALRAAAPGLNEAVEIREDADYERIGARTRALGAELILGTSKAGKLARELDLPLVRVGFPIHDRLGGQRQLLLGYAGAQQLFDTLVNVIIEREQSRSDVGYGNY